MSNVSLPDILDVFLKEDKDQAKALLHDWFVTQFKKVNEELMSNIDEALDDDQLADDKPAGDEEEFYADGELSTDDADAEDGEAEVDLDGGAEELDNTDVDGITDVKDLAAELSRLAAEFNAAVGNATAPEDMDTSVDMEPELGDEGGEIAPTDDLDVDAEVEVPAPVEAMEDVLDFSDLDEAVEPELSPIKSNIKANTEIGADGKKVGENDKSPLPNHKGPDRVGGKPVEVRSTQHNGYAMETPPKTVTRGKLNNEQTKDSEMLSPVSKEGDKSALLNKKDGFGSDSPKSPIGGGNADLRGGDFRRK